MATTTEQEDHTLVLNKKGHANFCLRCLIGLPAALVEADSSRIAIGFYALGALDILGLLDARLKFDDRSSWCAWMWEQQVRRPRSRARTSSEAQAASGGVAPTASEKEEEEEEGTITFAGADDSDEDEDDSGDSEGPSRRTRRSRVRGADSGSDDYVGGFRPSPFMHVDRGGSSSSAPASIAADADTDPPHLIMTYTALLSLAILRDDFTRLDRRGLLGLLRATQQADGSFTAIPNQGEADLRMVYTAFAICTMLDDWSAIDVPRALAFVRRCMTYEGGFGQAPGNEAQGGPTYCALATLALAPSTYQAEATLTREERRRAVRWLVWRQAGPSSETGEEGERKETEEETETEDEEDDQGPGETTTFPGGMSGRTEKAADACYSFWCGAGLHILDSAPLVDVRAHTRFLAACQGRMGGLAKTPGPTSPSAGNSGAAGKGTGAPNPDPYHTYLALAALSLYPPSSDKEMDESWTLARLDPLLNATEETAAWVREKVSGRG